MGMKTIRKSLRLISCVVLGAAILAPMVVGKDDHAEADTYYGNGYTYYGNGYTYNSWYNNYYSEYN